MKTVVVVAGGPGVPAQFDVPDGATVIAADARVGAGVVVDVAVGDFDSVDPEELGTVGRVVRHPAAKDASDLELALQEALQLEPARILVVGSAGGRLDHLFGSLLLLAADELAAVQVDAVLGGALVHVVRGSRELAGEVGELVSLFAANGRAEGVTTEGLEYPLAGEPLEPGSSRGLSNVFAATAVRITVDRGVLLVVRPGPAG